MAAERDGVHIWGAIQFLSLRSVTSPPSYSRPLRELYNLSWSRFLFQTRGGGKYSLSSCPCPASSLHLGLLNLYITKLKQNLEKLLEKHFSIDHMIVFTSTVLFVSAIANGTVAFRSNRLNLSHYEKGFVRGTIVLKTTLPLDTPCIVCIITGHSSRAGRMHWKDAIRSQRPVCSGILSKNTNIL